MSAFEVMVVAASVINAYLMYNLGWRRGFRVGALISREAMVHALKAAGFVVTERMPPADKRPS